MYTVPDWWDSLLGIGAALGTLPLMFSLSLLKNITHDNITVFLKPFIRHHNDLYISGLVTSHRIFPGLILTLPSILFYCYCLFLGANTWIFLITCKLGIKL